MALAIKNMLVLQGVSKVYYNPNNIIFGYKIILYLQKRCVMSKVTLETIAKEIGTTKNTVSRALRNKPGVGEALRSKIVDMAEQVGYHKNGKETNDSFTKVTMVCNSALTTDTYFWPSVIRGVFEYSSKHQISIQSVIIDMIKDDVKYLLPLQEKHCDGILVIGGIPDIQFKRIADLGIPMVAIDHYSDYVACDYINTANVNGIIRAVDFLVDSGHRKIGFINNETAPYNYSLTQRHKGFLRRMEALGLEVDSNFVWPNASYSNNEYIQNQMKQWGSHKDMPTAWICGNDLTAYNFCTVLLENGLSVPDDMSIIGFDNIPGVFHTQLTTLDVPQHTMGISALRKLMRRLRHPDEPYENIEIFTNLLVRGSVKKI